MMIANEPSSKRIRKEEDESSLQNVISSRVFQHVSSYANSYKSATPYPHGMIQDIFVDGFLDQVREELKNHSKVKFKESDLFRVYQSIDLGNLEPSRQDLVDALPNLMALRRAIYSPTFISFMEQICDLEPGTLTGQIDCAVNCHIQGCHLLCHDDVIGTRKISYIFYLTDPDPVWTDADGGRLELYSCDDTITNHSTNIKVPQVHPCKTILPIFNSMAYFKVEPGVSFHAVSEVFCDRPRLSIQGWYHAKERPLRIEYSTLHRLKSTQQGEDTEGDFITCKDHDHDHDTSTPLSSSDIEFLSQYINKTYLEDSSMTTIRQRFEEESSVLLRHFLNEEWENKIKDASSNLDKKQQLGRRNVVLDYSVGVDENWIAVGPAHKQRFLEYNGLANQNSSDPGAMMLYLKQTLLESSAFGRLLQSFTSLSQRRGYRGRVRRFRPGFDYTVAHYGILTKKCVLDSTLCFVAGTGDQCQYDSETEELIGTDDDAMWDSGDYGGFEVYIAADDEGGGGTKEAEDEYNDEDDTELLSVSASSNSLSLVYRDPGTMRFVKYVGNGAPGSRWDIAIEYEVEDDAMASDESKIF